MILGMDSNGAVFVTLLQVNNDKEMMSIYLQHLVKFLDKRNPKWREDSVILLDGAPAHTGDTTMETLKRLKIPAIQTAPYSFSACPVELFFGRFKSTNINPNFLPLGKRQV
jgi:hypothetical protein